MQRELAADQVSAFYQGEFAQQQADHFATIALTEIERERVAGDIGGDCDFSASTLENYMQILSNFLDMDPVSIAPEKLKAIEAMVGDAIQPTKNGDEGGKYFSYFLHHLVGSSQKGFLFLARKFFPIKETRHNTFLLVSN